MDKHDAIQDLKQVAKELNRVPGRDEYRSNLGKVSEAEYKRLFGTWGLFVTAAGFPPSKPGPRQKRKISLEDMFGKDLAQHLEAYRKTKDEEARPLKKDFKSIAVVGDLHFPFTNLDTLTAFYHFIAEQQPRCVVQVGDLYDFFAHSKFPKSLNLYTPAQEMKLAREMAEEFWKTVQRLVPGVECYQILGNHDVRPLKRVMETYEAGEMFFNLDKFFAFDQVETNLDYRQELILGDIVFHHGYRSQLGQHRDHFLKNTVVGHTHRGGVSFRQMRGEILWELNAGYMGDASSKALSYTSSKVVDWTQGWGWIDTWGPRFIPA